MSENKMTETKIPTHAELRKLFDAIYPQRPDFEHLTPEVENGMRMYRALSWLKRYEECKQCRECNLDEQFLFLWISFNAAYGDNAYWKSFFSSKEIDKIKKFLFLIVNRDENDLLAGIIRAHTTALNQIAENRFLFRPFWKAAYNKIAWLKWSSPSNEFVTKNLHVHNMLQSSKSAAGKTTTVLQHIFERLYTLRNQIFHGSATYRGSYNRSSLEPGVIVLETCVPAILKIMLEEMKKHPDTDVWGQIEYPPFLLTPDDDTNLNPPKRY